MNIHDITANLNISTFTPQSAPDRIRALPTSAELMVKLIHKCLEKHPVKTVEKATEEKVDIIT